MTEEELKEKRRAYNQNYQRSHPEKIREARKRYRARHKKNKGIFLYNDHEEYFFNKQIEAAAFLGVAPALICRAVNTDHVKVKGYEAEKAL